MTRGSVRLRAFSLSCAAFVAFATVRACDAAQFDPLDIPAAISPLASRSLLTAVVKAPGGRWVAVGRRGHILLSADAINWEQAASVPVSSDLVGVFFIDANRGWAVGHGGVILATSDGGRRWTKQYDGMRAAEALVGYYEPLAARSDDPEIAFGLRDAMRFKEAGPGRPFLDIWFASEKRGYAIGAYNLLFTTDDGGYTWEPHPDLLTNEMAFHLNTIARVGEEIYIAGEQGLFARWNRLTGRFDNVKTPYPGTFFGLTGKEGLLVLFGLQGNAFRSRNNGTTWEKIDPGLYGTITAGTVMPDGRLVLASQGGVLAISDDDGAHFVKSTPAVPTPIHAIAPGTANSIIAVGLGGVKVQSLPQGGN